MRPDDDGDGTSAPTTSSAEHDARDSLDDEFSYLFTVCFFPFSSTFSYSIDYTLTFFPIQMSVKNV